MESIPLKMVLSTRSKKFSLSAVLLSLYCFVATLHAVDDHTEEGIAKGVNPKDNITKCDLIGKYDHYDDRINISSLALKYDRALGAIFGVNLEVPMVAVESPEVSKNGLGDILLRGRAVRSYDHTTIIAAAELVFPTASDDVLGAGKWQINPVLGAVHMLSPTLFCFAGYKHITSFAGDDDRFDLNQSQPRALMAYTSYNGWWVLADGKYTFDWNLETNVFDLEAEAGQMLNHSIAISGRVGTSFLDSTREFGMSINLRYLF
jgi:hypothetical protein